MGNTFHCARGSFSNQAASPLGPHTGTSFFDENVLQSSSPIMIASLSAAPPLAGGSDSARHASVTVTASKIVGFEVLRGMIGSRLKVGVNALCHAFTLRGLFDCWTAFARHAGHGVTAQPVTRSLIRREAYADCVGDQLAITRGLLATCGTSGGGRLALVMSGCQSGLQRLTVCSGRAIDVRDHGAAEMLVKIGAG